MGEVFVHARHFEGKHRIDFSNFYMLHFFLIFILLLNLLYNFILFRFKHRNRTQRFQVLTVEMEDAGVFMNGNPHIKVIGCSRVCVCVSLSVFLSVLLSMNGYSSPLQCSFHRSEEGF